MKIDLYHLNRGFHFSNLAYPIILDVLKVWAESVGWQARVRVCEEDGVDTGGPAGVVGISVYSRTAPAAYRVAEQLRRQGKIVVLGGPHFRGPSTYKEASPFCDIIVSSVCEAQWKRLLDDIARGRISPKRRKPIYVADTSGDFRYPNNFHEAIGNRRWYQMPTVPTSIGCPYDCSYCSPYMQGRYILRDIHTIHNEVAHIKGKMVIICDATFGLNKKFTIDLMKALGPLHKKIAVETTLGRLKDREVLGALALGGVKWIVAGIETVGSQLRKHGSVAPHTSLRQVVDEVHARGMLLQGNFICGLDSDGPESFEQIYRCYAESGLDAIMIGILTPYPHTALYRELQVEGRIFDTNWEHYDYHHVVYRPLRMTVDQLIDGYLGLYRRVRKRNSIFTEALNGYRRSGLSLESSVMVANNLYQGFDFWKKERMLRRNQRQLASLTSPSLRPALGSPGGS